MTGLGKFQALSHIVDLRGKEFLFRCCVEAVVKLSSEKVHPHDAEDEPKDETHQENVKDGGDGSYQGVHHHLCIDNIIVWSLT